MILESNFIWIIISLFLYEWVFPFDYVFERVRFITSKSVCTVDIRLKKTYSRIEVVANAVKKNKTLTLSYSHLLLQSLRAVVKYFILFLSNTTVYMYTGSYTIISITTVREEEMHLDALMVWILSAYIIPHKFNQITI